VAALVVAVIWSDFSFTNRPSVIALALALLGGALNIVALCLNGGRMPIRADVIPPSYEHTHRPMDERTRVRVLGDWIAFRGCLLSPGDVSLFAGQVAILAWALCCLASKSAGVSL